MRYRYRLTKLKKRQPEKYNSITNRILLDLTDLEKAVNESKEKNWIEGGVGFEPRMSRAIKSPELSYFAATFLFYKNAFSWLFYEGLPYKIFLYFF